MLGLFSGRAEHGCFHFFLHTGSKGGLLFWWYGNMGVVTQDVQSTQFNLDVHNLERVKSISFPGAAAPGGQQ